jgi:hypothetical protein
MVVYGIDIFTRAALKHLIVYSLRYFQNKKATQGKEASVKKNNRADAFSKFMS